jgi:hypothetical protein
MNHLLGSIVEALGGPWSAEPSQVPLLLITPPASLVEGVSVAATEGATEVVVTSTVGRLPTSMARGKAAVSIVLSVAEREDSRSFVRRWRR